MARLTTSRAITALWWLAVVVGAIASAVKNDHLQGVREEDQAESTEVAATTAVLPPGISEVTEVPHKDVSLMQVALTVHSSTGSKTHRDLGKTISAAKGAAMAVAQDVGSAAEVAAEMAEKTATAALSEASLQLQESQEPQELQVFGPNMSSAKDTVISAALVASDASKRASSAAAELAKDATDAWSEASAHVADGHDKDGAHEIRRNVSHAHRAVVRSEPLHPSAANNTRERAKEHSSTAAGGILAILQAALHFIKDSVCTLYVLLRVAILLTGCVSVHLVRRGLEIGVEKTGKTTAAAKAFCKEAIRAQVQKYAGKQSLKKPVGSQKCEVPGRDRYEPNLHSEHPDLYEPSPFHEDRDKRRAVAGGE